MREHTDGGGVGKHHDEGVARVDGKPSGLAALVVDDDVGLRQSLRLCLETSFDRVLGVGSVVAALEAVQRARFDVIVLDLWLGASSTLPIVADLAKQHGASVIVMADPSRFDMVVQALKLGAVDYLAKPITLDQVRMAVRHALASRIEEDRPSVEPADADAFMETRSAVFRAFLQTAERAASADCGLLLRGESGTGKNVIAQWIHDRSPRRAEPFVAVNCPGLAGDLMASALFGHKKGSFTGAFANASGKVHEANGGTLFLDEIGDLGLDAQARLLRFLNDRTFERVGDPREERANVRILAATNRDLEAQVKAGGFREDLLYRLDVITLRLPTLRDRADDIALLADHFLRRAAARHGRNGITLGSGAVTALAAHGWAGNLRELSHAVERAVILAPANVIEARDLGIPAAPERRAPALGADVALHEIEREHIALVLARSATMEAAARSLGIDTTTLQRKRRRYGLT